MILSTTEHQTSASNPPALDFNDDLPTSQADGNQDTQPHDHRSGTATQSQQIEGEDEEAVELKAWPCGCDEAPNPHIENLATFQRHVRDGLRNLKLQDVRYEHIEALMVYWKGGDVPKLADKAKS